MTQQAAPTFLSGTPAEPSSVQGPLANFIHRDAPLQARLRIAKAAVPAPPEVLVPALLVVSYDPEAEVKQAARESLLTMPADVLLPVLRGLQHEALLDAAARTLVRNAQAVRDIALNNASADDTIRWLAGSADRELADLIGRNQVRALRYPAIIEALYLNPLAPQGTVQGLVELAVRNQINLDHVPGFRETKALLLGEERDDGPAGLTESEFASAMLMAMGQGEWRAALGQTEPAAVAATGEDGELTDTRGKSLAALIGKMSVSQKVRIASVGDSAVRKLLIRDPKKLVAFAVLKSPRLTESEITSFAANKALSEDVLSAIARNRQWTKDYATRKALTFNPKTPLALSLQFLRTLNAKDMKECSQSRDVNPNIARAAKRILTEAEDARNKKK
jgi:hypothetical protein